MKSKETLIIFLKGLLMGVAQIIPGVSGGTIALITGIYERLVHSISKIDFRFIPRFLKGDFKGAKANIRNIDFRLFIPLIAGIGLAFWLMSHIISFFLQNFAAPTYAFFSGLILASAVLICKRVGRLSVRNIPSLVIGFLFAFVFAGLATLQIGHSLPVLALSGALALCAMILPGISGAFVLLFLNQYEYMLSVLRNWQFLEIFTFGFGALIGILFFSRLMDYLFAKYRSFTMFFLTGLMLGALRIPYRNIVDTMNSFLPVLIAAILGFSTILILEGISRKLGGASRTAK